MQNDRRFSCVCFLLLLIGCASSPTVPVQHSKPSRRVVDVAIDYVGFKVEDQFVVGYGLDFGENYRSLKYIGVLKPHLYANR